MIMVNGDGRVMMPMRWRFEFLFAVLMLSLVALGVRLTFLLAGDRSEKLRLVSRHRQRVITLPGRDGSIRIRGAGSYLLLAGSRRAPACFADPQLLDKQGWSKASFFIARALLADGSSGEIDDLRWEIHDKIISRRERGGRFVILRTDLTPTQLRAIKVMKSSDLKTNAVGIVRQWRREYPCGSLASSVLGFRRDDGVAGGGIELSLDKYLRGTDGKDVSLTDARRRSIWPVWSKCVPARNGSDVYLSLDANIQGYLEKAVGRSVSKFNAQWGNGIVVDPFSGRVLAMCSSPDFDPNMYGQTEASRMTNRVISCPVEPGSVAKPIFTAAAVQEGVIGFDTRINCENGRYRAHRGGTITDHGKRFGFLTARRINVVSSNIGMSKIGELLGNARLYAISRRFGFGHRVGVDLPGESPGMLRPVSRWDGYSLRRVPFGQEISVTSLQLAMAYCALVNGGLLYPPRIIDHITDSQGKDVPLKRAKPVRVLNPEISAATLDMLRGVVEDNGGTGKNARLTHWTSFGKTGTAQIPGVGGYNDTDFLGSFIGGAPATKPAVICLISIYKPDKSIGHYGGTVAAPYVREVLEQTLEYLHVKPDKLFAMNNEQ